jgi:hypothetical protein
MSSIAVFLVLGGASAYAAKKIGANELKANSVKTGKIVKEAVTTSKIKNESVTTAKIAKEAVTSDKIADNAVNSSKIASNAVTTGKIADDAVTGDKIKESTLAGVVQNVTFASAATPGNISEDKRTLTVDCGAGKVALGGFYEAFDFGPAVQINVHILRHVSIGGEANRGIQVFAEEITATANNWQLTASATCATV